MELSILIPIYRYDPSQIVWELIRQADGLPDLECEIILYDDGSHTSIDSGIIDSSRVVYRAFTENVGRSAIRNQMSRKAKGKYLLFLDGDGYPLPMLLASYRNYWPEKGKIRIGGRKYQALPPSKEQLWHWKYGKQREEDLHEQNQFMSHNFCIRAEDFEAIRFDESLVNYGYEDALFAFQAKQHGMEMLPSSATTLHLDIQDNQQFLHKTNEALSNLANLSQLYPNLGEEIYLLKVYRRWKPLVSVLYYLAPLCLFLFRCTTLLVFYDAWRLLRFHALLKRVRR